MCEDTIGPEFDEKIPFRWKRTRLQARQRRVGRRVRQMWWLFGACAVFVCYRWCSAPYDAIDRLRNGSAESAASAEADLIRMGGRATWPMIVTIGHDAEYDHDANKWLKAHIAKFGPPLHRELLNAIDNPAGGGWDQLSLINALQVGYGDYSRVGLWLDRLGNFDHEYSNGLQRSLSEHFGEVPRIGSVDDDKPLWNPAFIRWYQQTRASIGQLPAYDFQRPHDF